MNIDTINRLDALFVASAIEYPERPALQIDGTACSYRSLLEASERIRCAVGRYKTTPGTANVALLCTKSIFAYAALIGILRNGDAYVPLNPKWPVERWQQVVRDADIEVVVTDLTDNALSPDAFGDDMSLVRRNDLPPLQPSWQDGVLEQVLASSPDSLAYIIYTSGSTGTPKGVALTHRNVTGCMRRVRKLFPLRCDDRFTQIPDFSFDLSVSDLFLCWGSGACLFVPTAAQAMMPWRFMSSNVISVATLVPSLANNMKRIGALAPGNLPSVRLTLFCGEALPAEIADAWARAAPHSVCVNLYGPTETAVYASYHVCTPRSGEGTPIVPIGRIFDGLEHEIVDVTGEPCSTGVPGELCIGGDQVSRGYWKNEAATHASFFERRNASGVPLRWYRTGDIVAQRADGELTFLGRQDRQVKVNGHRVELAEIEGALKGICSAHFAAVIALSAADTLSTQLVAFSDNVDDERRVLQACAARLPAYMVPTRVFELRTFPFSDNGKLDMRSLNARAAHLMQMQSVETGEACTK